MFRALLLLSLVACHHPSPRPTPSNTVAPDVVEPEVPPASPCQRYNAAFEKVEACTQLPRDTRDDLLQRHSDHVASIAEMGLDEGPRFDPEDQCEEELAHALKLAQRICHL